MKNSHPSSITSTDTTAKNGIKGRKTNGGESPRNIINNHLKPIEVEQEEEMPGGGSNKKCAIVSLKEAPAYMRGNIYIWTGYRVNYTWKATFLSLFSLHNGIYLDIFDFIFFVFVILLFVFSSFISLFILFFFVISILIFIILWLYSETWNIWTHFVGFWLFVGLTFYSLNTWLADGTFLDKAMFLAWALAAQFQNFASTFFHWFSCINLPYVLMSYD